MHPALAIVSAPVYLMVAFLGAKQPIGFPRTRGIRQPAGRNIGVSGRTLLKNGASRTFWVIWSLHLIAVVGWLVFAGLLVLTFGYLALHPGP